MSSGGSGPGRPGTLRIGRIAGIDVEVQPSWLLIALLIAAVMAPRAEAVAPGLGPLAYVAGLAFAVLLYASILVYEVAHALSARHYGQPVRSISIHFLGGATEFDDETPSPRAQFVTALVGPLASILVGVVALLLTSVLDSGLIGLAVASLAVANLTIGVLNLVPGLPLDGGHLLAAAVWRFGGDRDRGTLVAGWVGRVVAVLVVGYPFALAVVADVRVSFVDVVMALVLAYFLWGAASAAVHYGQLRRRLPLLVARTLARPVIVVPQDLPVAEAVRQAREAGAGAIATRGPGGGPDEEVAGLVDENALQAMPPDRRPWAPVSTLARTLDPGLRLSADLVGEDLVRAMEASPASEYLLLEPGGGVYGVLVTADVNAAFVRAG